MSTSHQRNARTGLECQLCDPPLLRQSPPTANRPLSSRFLLITHDDIVDVKMSVGQRGTRDACRERMVGGEDSNLRPLGRERNMYLVINSL
jgi:hypothetical protein